MLPLNLFLAVKFYRLHAKLNQTLSKVKPPSTLYQGIELYNIINISTRIELQITILMSSCVKIFKSQYLHQVIMFIYHWILLYLFIFSLIDRSVIIYISKFNTVYNPYLYPITSNKIFNLAKQTFRDRTCLKT